MDMLVEAAQQATRLLIVDDHPLVRSGIKALIQLEDDMEVCGEAEDHMEAMSAIDQNQPDLVLVDISLKNSNGLNLLRDISQHHPKIHTLAVSMHDEYTYAVRCLKAGAKGYVMKQEGTEKIRDAIRHVISGKTYLSINLSVDRIEAGHLTTLFNHEAEMSFVSEEDLVGYVTATDGAIGYVSSGTDTGSVKVITVN